MTNAEFAGKLRELAWIYEASENIPQPADLMEGSTLFIFCDDKSQFSETVKAFGPGTKGADEDSIFFRPNLHPSIRINAFKANTCERVQVAEKVIPAIHIPARDIPERIEPIYEFRCGSFLDPSAPALEEEEE